MSFLNNNPGNIRYAEGVTPNYQGLLGGSGGFCRFDTPENGIRAIGVVLRAYQSLHGIDTIREAITRWAPPSENDTAAYVSAVSSDSGLGPDEQIDFDNDGVLQMIVPAIIKHENGVQPYSPSQIAAGVAAGDVA